MVVAQRADRFAGPVPVTAGDALSADIDRSNGLILYYEASLRVHEDPVMRSMLNAERGHQHKLTQTALAQKIDEKRAVVSELTIDALERVLRIVVEKLGEDPESRRVREIVTDALRAVVVTPDDPYGAAVEAEVVQPWESDFSEWESQRGMSGPLSNF